MELPGVNLGLGPREKVRDGGRGSAGTGRGRAGQVKFLQAWMRLASSWLPTKLCDGGMYSIHELDEHLGVSPRRSGSYNGGYRWKMVGNVLPGPLSCTLEKH